MGRFSHTFEMMSGTRVQGYIIYTLGRVSFEMIPGIISNVWGAFEMRFAFELYGGLGWGYICLARLATEYAVLGLLKSEF